MSQFFPNPCPVNRTCDILDKHGAVHNYIDSMLNRTSQMFEYPGLPDTIPSYILETYLQVYGGAAVCKVNGELYVIFGSPGGPLDPYYRPTIFIMANPALGDSRQFKIYNHFAPFDKIHWQSLEPCVYIRNDTQARGLIPIYARYATQLAENDVSIRSAQINSRQVSLISASTDAEQQSAEKYIADIEAGKLSVVAENPFLNGIKAQNVTTMSANSIIQLIELQQYLKASWFNEIGLNSNFNMKREYLSTDELQASTDILLPLSDDMLMQRELGVKAINECFGTNISVKKNSAWENQEKEIAAVRGEMNEEANEGSSQSTEDDSEDDGNE